MTEKRKINDDELVEVTGAGEYEDIKDDRGPRPVPGPGPDLPEQDNEPGGDVHIQPTID